MLLERIERRLPVAVIQMIDSLGFLRDTFWPDTPAHACKHDFARSDKNSDFITPKW
jgi:hypothetical protein